MYVCVQICARYQRRTQEPDLISLLSHFLPVPSVLFLLPLLGLKLLPSSRSTLAIWRKTHNSPAQSDSTETLLLVSLETTQETN